MGYLVSAEDASIVFQGGGVLRSRSLRAVSDLNLAIETGSTLGLVGESGSGKSTIGRMLLGLIAPSSGEVSFDGVALSAVGRDEMRRLRRRMQLVFQDPLASLNPRRRIGRQLMDGMLIHGLATTDEAGQRVGDLLTKVGLDPSLIHRFPHEFSGGQRQRIAIARALSTNPDFIVADEPVSALDMSVQAQILSLLAELRHTLSLTMLFISHDLLVVKHLCDRICVLYLGRVVEEGPTEALFSSPAHPYTRNLLAATPRLVVGRKAQRTIAKGEPPSPLDPPSGCVFRTRCAHAISACSQAIPALRTVGSGHRVACIRDDIVRSGAVTSGL